MYSKEEVTAKLDEYKTYSIQQKPNYESQYTSLMAPLYAAVETYFSTVPDGMIDQINLFVHEAYCDTWNRAAKWENEFPVDRPTDVPAGVSDFRENFYKFDWMETTPAAFFAAWVEGTPEGGESGGEGGIVAPPEPICNSLIDSWVPEVTAAPDQDLANVKASTQWCASSSGSGMLVNLLEDQGRLEEYKTTREIAEDIYIDRGLFEVIQFKGYDVYIPSYLQTSATLAKGYSEKEE